MFENIKKTDIIAGLIAIVLAILSYVLYEKNIVVSIAIFLAILLVYRKYIRNRGKKRVKRFKRFGDDE
ncbi:MAG: hypothetical protein ACRCTZ_12340 [Sarcina sp.]